MKHSQSLYTLSNHDLSNIKISETNEPLVKLTNELSEKSTDKNGSSTKLAQNYLEQKLIHVNRDFHSNLNRVFSRIKFSIFIFHHMENPT